MMLEMFGHPTQQNHDRTSASVKAHDGLCFEFTFLGRGKSRVRFVRGEDKKSSENH